MMVRKKILAILGFALSVSFSTCPGVSAEQFCPEDGSACYEVTPLKDQPSDAPAGTAAKGATSAGAAA
ncbi:MAG: hypothetical protein QMC36_08235 [Patescibacteria group bacterium]